MNTTATHETTPDHNAMQEAAEWFALLRSSDVSPADQADWQRWHDSQPQHQQAWHYVERISRRFEPVRAQDHATPATIALQKARGMSQKRRKSISALAVLLGAGAAGWGAWRVTPLGDTVLSWTADHTTATGEIRELVLDDGTRVWLNTASAMNVDYSPALRRLQLLRGELLIDTAADTTRPFVVDTANGRMQALGTRFTVRTEDKTTFLAVYQGAVRIKTRNGRAEQIVNSGKQTRFDAEHIGPLENADPARESWSKRLLLADNIPLADVVHELNRYQHAHLSLAPELSNLRVFGGYPLQDPAKALRMLAEVQPIQIRRILPWWISIEKKTAATDTKKN